VRKTLVRIAIAVVVLAAGGVGLRFYLKRNVSPGKDVGPSTDRVVPVLTVAVARRDMPIYLDGLGNALASATVTVHVQVDGRIERITFREGQTVKKGDLLAEIDARPFQNQLHTAQAAAVRDRAQLVGAQKDLERFTQLAKSGLGGAQQVDDATTQAASLQATLGSDQVAIDSARLSLDYTRVTAPIDGVTGIRIVDQGNIVHASDPGGIVVIATLDPMAVVFTLPQDPLPAIQAELARGPVVVEAFSRDGTTKLATGTLGVIDNQINTATATLRIKALFPNKDHTLWPNQFVKTRLLLSTRKDAIVIPAAVVQHGPKGDFAYVVGSDKKAEARPIRIDLTEDDVVIVASGLEPGEVVVLDGQNQLRPGSAVAPRVADASPSGSPGGSGAPLTSSSGAHAPAASSSGAVAPATSSAGAATSSAGANAPPGSSSVVDARRGARRP